MKRIIIFFAIFFIMLSAHGQLANTSWKGTITLNQPVDVLFNFGNDTLEVLNTQDSSEMETMKYALNNNVLTLSKLFGHSMCDETTPGIYSCNVNGNQMFLNGISDACDDRKTALTNVQLTKVQ